MPKNNRLQAHVFVICINLLYCTSVRAASDTEKALNPLSLANVCSVFFALLIVLAMLFAAVWLLKRLQRVKVPTEGASIQVVAQLQLGMKERVVLLRVGDENILVGCTAGNIRSLHVWQGIISTVKNTHVPTQPLFIDTIKSLLTERMKP